MDTDVLVASLEEKGIRVDKALADRFDQKSRSYFQFLIEQGFVLINGSKVKKRTLLEEGDEIEVLFQATPEISLNPEEIPLDILYEDDHLLAINKPAGMVVHPAPGHWSGTFVNALLGHCQKRIQPEEPIRPGIVHRLDKDTSGVLLAAKTAECHEKLSDLFYHKEVKKDYLAICLGKVRNGRISAPIGRNPRNRKEMAILEEGGKEAHTDVQLLAFHEGLSLVLVRPITGRTHQIRVHLKSVKTPILGDPIYGSTAQNQKHQTPRQYLHAYRIRFNHPITDVPMELIAPLPDDIKKVLERFKFSSSNIVS